MLGAIVSTLHFELRKHYFERKNAMAIPINLENVEHEPIPTKFMKRNISISVQHSHPVREIVTHLGSRTGLQS